MELLVLSNYGQNEVVKTSSVSDVYINELMQTLDWNQFHQVCLTRNNQNWIEVGGNIKEDGLACIYEENGEQFVIDVAPTSIAQITDILISYYNGDDRYKTENKFTGEQEVVLKKENDSRKYQIWKKDFYAKRKRESSSQTKRIILVLAITAGISLTSYLWFIGELQFIGHKTEFTKAIVVNTQMYHIGKGYYLQTVTYEFVYKDVVYSGTFEAGKSVGKQEIGNSIKIKFSLRNPDHSKMIGIYKR